MSVWLSGLKNHIPTPYHRQLEIEIFYHWLRWLCLFRANLVRIGCPFLFWQFTAYMLAICWGEGKKNWSQILKDSWQHRCLWIKHFWAFKMETKTILYMLRPKAKWQIKNQKSLVPFLVQLVTRFINSVLGFHANRMSQIKLPTLQYLSFLHQPSQERMVL